MCHCEKRSDEAISILKKDCHPAICGIKIYHFTTKLATYLLQFYTHWQTSQL